MNITFEPDLEAALNDSARRQGIAPSELIKTALRERFLGSPAIVPRDDWERLLLTAASDCGVGVSHEAVSSEGLYD